MCVRLGRRGARDRVVRDSAASAALDGRRQLRRQGAVLVSASIPTLLLVYERRRHHHPRLPRSHFCRATDAVLAQCMGGAIVSRSGAVVGCAGWAKSVGPSSSRPKLFFFINNLPVTLKMRTSGCQTLECFAATLPTLGVYGRLVHVGETFSRFADLGL